MEQEIAARRTVALEVGLEAMALCRAAYGGHQVVQRKGHLDVVTETDGAVERAIVARLRAAFPHDRIVGEEGEAADVHEALHDPGFCWLLDPICGTDNFASGLSALYCSNVVLLESGIPVLAVVAEGPQAQDLLCAVRGEGAYLVDRSGGEQPIQASDESSLVAFDAGYLPSWGRPERPARVIAELLRLNRYSVRMMSTSLTLAQQVRGALSGNIIDEAKPWDLAGGALLLAEAGAVVSDMQGKPWSIDGLGLVAGSSAAIHADLLACVRQGWVEDEQ